MNTMNEHIIYAYIRVRQQEYQPEAATYRLIKEACNSRQGFLMRMRCWICLRLSRHLIGFGKRMAEIAQKSQENAGEFWSQEEPLALTRR